MFDYPEGPPFSREGLQRSPDLSITDLEDSASVASRELAVGVAAAIERRHTEALGERLAEAFRRQRENLSSYELPGDDGIG